MSITESSKITWGFENHCENAESIEFDLLERIVVVRRYHLSDWFEIVFLGRWPWFGYGNYISGSRRIFTGAFQTIFALVALYGCYWLAEKFGVIGGGVITDQDARMSMLLLVSGIFAGTLFNEKSSLYSKWNYLAHAFNSALNLPEPTKAHAMACLAHDLIVMEMWAHRSFRAMFKDAVRDAICLEMSGKTTHAVSLELSRVAKNGISYDRALNIIGDLTEELAPEVKRAPKQI